MAVNRFNNPLATPVQQTYVSQFVPLPFDVISKSLDRSQQKYDQGEEAVYALKGAMGEQMLDVDNPLMTAYVQGAQEQINKAVDSYNGDYSKMAGFARNVAQDYKSFTTSGPGAIGISSLNAYQEAKKEKTDMDAEDQDYRLASAYKNYSKKGGALGGESLSVDAAYTNKDWDKELVEGISKMKASGSSSPDSRIVGEGDDERLEITNSSSEELTTDRIDNYIKYNILTDSQWQDKYEKKFKWAYEAGAYNKDLGQVGSKEYNKALSEYKQQEENRLIQMGRSFAYNKSKESLNVKFTPQASATAKAAAKKKAEKDALTGASVSTTEIVSDPKNSKVVRNSDNPVATYLGVSGQVGTTLNTIQEKYKTIPGYSSTTYQEVGQQIFNMDNPNKSFSQEYLTMPQNQAPSNYIETGNSTKVNALQPSKIFDPSSQIDQRILTQRIASGDKETFNLMTTPTYDNKGKLVPALVSPENYKEMQQSAQEEMITLKNDNLASADVLKSFKGKLPEDLMSAGESFLDNQTRGKTNSSNAIDMFVLGTELPHESATYRELYQKYPKVAILNDILTNGVKMSDIEDPAAVFGVNYVKKLTGGKNIYNINEEINKDFKKELDLKRSTGVTREYIPYVPVYDKEGKLDPTKGAEVLKTLKTSMTNNIDVLMECTVYKADPKNPTQTFGEYLKDKYKEAKKADSKVAPYDTWRKEYIKDGELWMSSSMPKNGTVAVKFRDVDIHLGTAATEYYHDALNTLTNESKASMKSVGVIEDALASSTPTKYLEEGIYITKPTKAESTNGRMETYEKTGEVAFGRVDPTVFGGEGGVVTLSLGQMKNFYKDIKLIEALHNDQVSTGVQSENAWVVPGSGQPVHSRNEMILTLLNTYTR